MKQTRPNSIKTDDSKPATLGDIREMLNNIKEEILTSVKEDLRKIENHLESLDSRIVNLEHIFGKLKNSQEKQQLEINELKSFVLQSEISKTELLNEVDDRVSRRNNIIVFGLLEDENGSSKDRASSDKEHTEEVFRVLGVEDLKISDTWRLGKKCDGKIRPLKVTLQDSILKKALVQKSRFLRKNTKFKNVYIDYDKTKFQQSEWNHLRRELNKRRESGEDVVIYNGSIHPRASLKNFH
jgi:hypothetical protein